MQRAQASLRPFAIQRWPVLLYFLFASRRPLPNNIFLRENLQRTDRIEIVRLVCQARPGDVAETKKLRVAVQWHTK